MKQFAAFALCIAFMGCAAHQIHPGTVNQFDSGTYDTLLVTDNVIQTTKADLAANKFPPAIAPNVKATLNSLIAYYNILDTVYCGVPIASTTTPGTLQCSSQSYHGALMLGNVTAVQTNAVTNAAADVTAATTKLATAKGGN